MKSGHFKTWEAAQVSKDNRLLAEKLDRDLSHLGISSSGYSGGEESELRYKSDFLQMLNSFERSIDLRTLDSTYQWKGFAYVVANEASKRLAHTLVKNFPDVYREKWLKFNQPESIAR